MKRRLVTAVSHQCDPSLTLLIWTGYTCAQHELGKELKWKWMLPSKYRRCVMLTYTLESCTQRVWSVRRLWKDATCSPCQNDMSDRSVCLQCRSRSLSSGDARCGARTPWSARCGWSETPTHPPSSAPGEYPPRPSRRLAPALCSPVGDGTSAVKTCL